MSLGMGFALIAVTFWLALGIAGERAPQCLWALPWMAVGILGVLLQWVACWATGREMP